MNELSVLFYRALFRNWFFTHVKLEGVNGVNTPSTGVPSIQFWLKLKKRFPARTISKALFRRQIFYVFSQFKPVWMNCQFCSMHRAFRIGPLETVILLRGFWDQIGRWGGRGRSIVYLHPFLTKIISTFSRRLLLCFRDLQDKQPHWKTTTTSGATPRSLSRCAVTNTNISINRITSWFSISNAFPTNWSR